MKNFDAKKMQLEITYFGKQKKGLYTITDIYLKISKDTLVATVRRFLASKIQLIL